jgi:Protein of unknown function (DUF2975)
MNANEITPKVNVRLNRVQKISKCIRLTIQHGCPLYILSLFVTGLLASKDMITLSTPPQSPETYLPNNFNGIFVIGQVSTLIVCLVWYYAALKLFGLFEKRILFTAETVCCLQILGAVYLARFLLELGIYFFIPLLEKIGHGVIWSDLFTGFFIICIGWLIDEARKIREEQELTV